MDWARAIERNSEVLAGIIAALFTVLGLTGGATLGRIERHLHSAVLRVLRPAESAVRRLIVIAARGLVVKPAPSRPMPRGRIIKRGGAARLAFQLFDTRKRFDFNRLKRIPDHKLPRSWVPSDTPSHVKVFRPEDFGRPIPEKKDGRVDATRLVSRLMAIKHALADLPRQAKRLTRWRAKREAMASPKFTSPLRIGRPPGYRKKPTHEVDEVLKECHALARDAMQLDTS